MTTMRCACAVWARLLVILSLEMAIAGCSGATTATAPPFEMGRTKIVKEGDPHNQHGAAYSIRISSPSEGSRYSQGDAIEVACELTVPDGGTMPADLDVHLLDRRGRILDSAAPRPIERQNDGTYLLRSRLTCPKHSGTFKIIAKGSDTVLLLPSGRADKKDPSDKHFSHRLLSSAPVTVGVK